MRRMVAKGKSFVLKVWKKAAASAPAKHVARSGFALVRFRARNCIATVMLSLLAACGGGGNSSGSASVASTATGGSSSSSTSGVQSPLTIPVPTILYATQSLVQNTLAFFGVYGWNPQNSDPTYTWTFGDGGTATGGWVSHAYSSEGSFSVRVTVTNQLGLSATSDALEVSVARPPLPPPVINAHGAKLLVGEPLIADLAFTEPRGLPFTIQWQTGGVTVGTATRLTYVYPAAGTYMLRATVTNSAGESASQEKTILVGAVIASEQPTPQDNVLQVYCGGAYCGASGLSTYSGSGTGVWRYRNSTNFDATINVSISGLSVGQRAALVFSNGGTAAAASLPNAGVTQSSVMSSATVAIPSEDLAAQAHTSMLLLNSMAAQQAIGTRDPSLLSVTEIPQRKTILSVNTPTIGATRVWRDGSWGGTNAYYNVKVAATCSLSTGRNAVFWLDADEIQRGELDPTRVTLLTDVVCGPKGAYERMVAMLGDVWGPAAASLSNYIQDYAGQLQDLNIVVIGVPQSTGWNGYFAAGDMLTKAAEPLSNAAVGVVLNGWVFGHYPASDPATRNTLVHELRHLFNFYQHTVVRGHVHSTWLEETSAMLAEDLIPTAVSPQKSRTEARVSGYSFSGGGTGYLGWTDPQGNSYNLGGAFGTFLHRHYGSSIDREILDCLDDGSSISSYQCVDAYIKRHGGFGFDDDFARVGAAAFGQMSWDNIPFGFGFPGSLVDDYVLEPIGLGAYEQAQSAPRSLSSVFLATSHTYSYEFMKAGQTTFRRDGVVVPAGTVLMIVVNEALP